MLSVFICYGGSQGEKIGNRLRDFLRREGFEAFLASPRSPDIPAGLDFDKVIESKLRNAHVMVAICNEGLLSSQYALREIDQASHLGIPIIPFIKQNLDHARLPPALQSIWAVRFRSWFVSCKFQRLELEIYRLVFFKIETQGRLLGNQPKVIGIPPEVLRR